MTDIPNSKKVHIPFKQRFIQRMEDGIKTWTSRPKKYGSVGDYFINTRTEYVIQDIFQMRLESVARDHWREEGFDSEKDFIDFWNEIHPQKGFVPEQLVWVHQFKRKYERATA